MLFVERDGTMYIKFTGVQKLYGRSVRDVTSYGQRSRCLYCSRCCLLLRCIGIGIGIGIAVDGDVVVGGCAGVRCG